MLENVYPLWEAHVLLPIFLTFLLNLKVYCSGMLEKWVANEYRDVVQLSPSHVILSLLGSYHTS